MALPPSLWLSIEAVLIKSYLDIFQIEWLDSFYPDLSVKCEKLDRIPQCTMSFLLINYIGYSFCRIYPREASQSNVLVSFQFEINQGIFIVHIPSLNLDLGRHILASMRSKKICELLMNSEIGEFNPHQIWERKLRGFFYWCLLSKQNN